MQVGGLLVSSFETLTQRDFNLNSDDAISGIDKKEIGSLIRIFGWFMEVLKAM